MGISYVQFGRSHIQNARNVTRTEIVSQYVNAFKRILVTNDQKFFANDPDLNPSFKAVCLGEYEDDTCWVNDQEHLVDHVLNDRVQIHLDNLPTILNDGVKFEGILYHCLAETPGDTFCTGNLSIYWFMEDLENETSSCSPGWTIPEYNDVYDGEVNGITFCTYIMDNYGNIAFDGASDENGDWEPWSQCTAECTTDSGTQFRTRECLNTAHGFNATCPDGGGIYESQACNGSTVCAGLDCGSHVDGSTWTQSESCISGYTTEIQFDQSSIPHQVDVPVYGTRNRLNSCTAGTTNSSSWTTCQ